MTYLTTNGRLDQAAINAEKRTLGGAVRLRVKSGGTFDKTSLLAVEEDGTEHPVFLVESVEVSVRKGEPNRAVVRFVEIDVQVEGSQAKGP